MYTIDSMAPGFARRPFNPRRHHTVLITAALVFAGLVPTGCTTSPEQKFANFMRNGEKRLQLNDSARALLEFRNAARIKPDRPEPYYQMALLELSRGELQMGIALLKKATDLDPKYAQAQTKFAEILAASPNAVIQAEAERRAQAAITSSGKSADALSVLALAELQRGNYDDASHHLEEAVKAFPESLRAWTTLASAKLTSGDKPAAIACIRNLTKNVPRSTEAATIAGRFFVLIGDLPQAEASFRRALQLNQTSGPALANLAGLQERMGNNEEAERLYQTLSRLPESEYRIQYAQFLVRRGRQQAMLAEVERLWKAAPEDRAVRSSLVSAFLASGRAAEAQTLLDRAIQKNSRDVEAHIQRADMYLRSGKLDAAETDLNSALQYKRESAGAHLLLARVHENQGKLNRQREELTEAVRLRPDWLAARVELSQALLSANAAAAALEVMNKTPPSQAAMLPAIVQKNWALLATGNDNEAAKRLAEGLAIERSGDLLIQDAVLRLKRRDSAGARERAEEALTRTPDDLRALQIISETYAAEKRPSTALAALKSHTERMPGSAPLQFFYGEQLRKTGDSKGARQAFLAAKTADPKYLAADLALAELDLAEHQQAAARKRLEGLVAANGRNTAALFLLGNAEELAGNKDRAIEFYRQVVSIEPSHLLALNNLAYLLADHSGRLDEALQIAEQAKQIAANNIAVDDTLGWIYFLKGRYQQALPYLENAAKSGAPQQEYHLAMASYRAGDRSRAMQVFASAMKKDATLPEARVAAQLLSSGSLQRD